MNDTVGLILASAILVGLCVVIVVDVVTKRKRKPQSVTKAVYIERIRGGYILRNTADDGEVGLRNPDNGVWQRMILYTPDEAVALAKKLGCHVDGIIGDVECIKSTIGEL